MSGYGGGYEPKVRMRPAFRRSGKGGCITRPLAIVIIIIVLLSQCNGTMPITRNGRSTATLDCFELGATRAYVHTLFDRDVAGLYDMDIDNDYLADVPKRCRNTVRLAGSLIAEEYRLSFER